MKLIHRIALIVTTATSLLAVSTSAQAAAKVGDPAPDFSLKASDGKTYKLSEFAGKKAVVIAWFPKAFTGGCTAECKSLREDGVASKAAGVALFAASVDDAETNKKFAESLGLDYPILADPTKETAKAYGVLNPANGLASRWTFLIGKDGKIAAIDQAVQPTSHGKAVLDQLQKLGLAK
ncbi:MAG: peroxiredoxin [Verrucomicrobiales bacterium]|nr:peroxiredoxin [Verrucomicrobiales bacterium]